MPDAFVTADQVNAYVAECRRRPVYPACPCGAEEGDNGCDLLFMGYIYCVGCKDHHRWPVETVEGRPCAIDQMSIADSRDPISYDGIDTSGWQGWGDR